MKLLWKPRVRPAEPARPRAFCQGSWMVIFWCKCGVNRKDRFRKMLTYQAFPPSGSYPAVAHEQYFNHLSKLLERVDIPRFSPCFPLASRSLIWNILV